VDEIFWSFSQKKDFFLLPQVPRDIDAAGQEDGQGARRGGSAGRRILS